VNDPSFYEKIYTRDGRWNKYDWTYDAFGAPGSTICSIDHDVHKRRRAALNAYFSKANVYSKLHIVQKAVKKLCYRMSEFSDPDTMMPFSVGAAAGAFTRDVATEFLLGKAFDNLDNESFNAELAAIFKNSGSLWRITKHIPWYGPMMKSIPSSWVEATSQEGIDRFLAFLKVCLWSFDLSRPLRVLFFTKIFLKLIQLSV
jgi:cytochrome P450